MWSHEVSHCITHLGGTEPESQGFSPEATRPYPLHSCLPWQPCLLPPHFERSRSHHYFPPPLSLDSLTTHLWLVFPGLPGLSSAWCLLVTPPHPCCPQSEGSWSWSPWCPARTSAPVCPPPPPPPTCSLFQPHDTHLHPSTLPAEGSLSGVRFIDYSGDTHSLTTLSQPLVLVAFAGLASPHLVALNVEGTSPRRPSQTSESL